MLDDMSDVDIPLHALRPQIASAIEIIVHAARLKNGARCITAIAEVLGYEEKTGYVMEDLFIREYDHDRKTGKMTSWLRATGRKPRCWDQMQGTGFELPDLDPQKVERPR